ncbi:glycosyltransferase 87 family protein [Streptomyces sp. NBC_00435]|uniref:glycosyltransferase 87 family protein n=1 Tax=Streptomyces sp. NBC_00435 TaxID=2903649 RepID=UPI002E1D60D6
MCSPIRRSLPLSWLPWPVAVVVVQTVSVFALLVIMNRSAVLLDGARLEHRRLMLWAAVLLWCEPVHHTLDLGQVNLVLAAIALSAAALPAGRPVLAGGGVGIATGMKLTPAVTSVYLLVAGRRKAALWSLAAFGMTLAIGWLVAPRESARFWLGLLWDTGRVGSVMSVRNQSLPGVLARLTGQDTGLGLLWCACAMLVLGTAVFAGYRATRRSDRLGVLLVVQLTGLMLLPISWSHHWVWCIPALMWLAAPTNRTHLAARLALAAWTLAAGTSLVPHLATAQNALTPGDDYPRLLAWLGTAYCVCGSLRCSPSGTPRSIKLALFWSQVVRTRRTRARAPLPDRCWPRLRRAGAPAVAGRDIERPSTVALSAGGCAAIRF